MRIVLISIAAAGLLLGFQNCSQVSFETSQSSLLAQQVEFLSSSSIEIDDNAEYTRQSLVKLKLFSIRAVEMKVSNDESCTDGAWEPYTTGKVWTLSKTNAQVKAYAQFKDLMGNISGCVSDDIIHDDQPPTAVFSNAADVVTNAPQMNLAWIARDNLSGVDSASCKGPDNVTAPCVDSFTVNSSTDGLKTIVLRVTDKAGNQSQNLIYDWLFDRTPPSVTINGRPAAINGSSDAVLSFVGQDALSGIAKYSCRVDAGAFTDCVSPKMFSGLSEGAHKFEVRSVDKAGNPSAVESYAWTVDLTAPVLSFTQTPPSYSASVSATLAFSGTDDGVAISKFDCSVDGGAFSGCSSPVMLSSLAQGNHSFSVRGYDNANNVSSPIKYSWVVDTSPPVVNITGAPAALGNMVSANFIWSVSDAGSGIKTLECRIDGAAYAACGAAGQVFMNLAAGSHTLNLRATDNAGNVSNASRTWVIDLTAPVTQILTGPDAYVNVTAAQFTFSASDANGIAGYECRLDAGAYGACVSPKLIDSLAEGGHVFFVRAIDKAGNVSIPVSRSWTIDKSPPIILVISAPVAIKQGASAIIEYETVDLSSGIAKVRCGLSKPAASIADCAQKQKIDLGKSLPMGSYVFDIEATDKVGNVITEKVNFQVTDQLLICDPFDMDGGQLCNGGLVGDIFYLDDANQASFKSLPNKTVDYFYANGVKVNALLALKQLSVSTRNFSSGFPGSDGSLIKDDTGATLHEYFAFRLETVLKLNPLLDQPGWYQFATLSDDGSMLLTKPQSASSYSTVLVSNDGDHSTRMGCSTSAVYIDDASRLPLMVKYYQGPRQEIALSLMWRRVAAMNSAVDEACGTSGAGDLASRGWRMIAPSNLIAPPK